MLLSKLAKTKWNSKTKNHYVNLGYTFTKIGDELEVKVEDLTEGSAVYVEIKCDYCGLNYAKHWRNYIAENNKSNIHKDACNKCKHLKASESVNKTYNVSNVFQLDSIKEKIIETNIDKYGVKNPFQSDYIKDKIKQTNLKKYGYEYAMQSDEIKEKVIKFNLSHYGITYSPKLKLAQQKGDLSPRWHGGALRNGLYRSTYQYKDWHNFVLERDNYTCQCCNDKNGNGHTVKLHVHHIFNFADNKELRYDVKNGITLCKDCHIEFHKLYGIKNTNETQLKEYILNHDKKIC